MKVNQIRQLKVHFESLIYFDPNEIGLNKNIQMMFKLTFFAVTSLDHLNLNHLKHIC